MWRAMTCNSFKCLLTPFGTIGPFEPYLTKYRNYNIPVIKVHFYIYEQANKKSEEHNRKTGKCNVIW